MDYRVKVSLGGAAVALAVGWAVSLVGSTFLATRTMAQRDKARASAVRDICVKGFARLRITSDLAVWDVEVMGEAPTLRDAYSTLDAGMAAVRGFLADKGFGAGEVAVGAIQTSEIHTRDKEGHDTHTVEAYTLRRVVTVTSPQVLRVQGTAGEISALIGDGVRLTSQRPAFYYSKLADLKISLLGEASRDARTRAEEIVNNSGGRVGSVRDARMGVLQVVRPNSTDMSAEGMYDTTTIDKDATAVVTLTYALEG